MSNTANDLTKRLLKALDSNYNVVDMRAISEVISVLENIHITKELLETTRLGKHVNELRRKTGDVALARRAKLLVKRWRDLIIPDRAGGKVDSASRQSPLAQPGISPAVTPAVTPRLCSPQVPVQGIGFSQKQGSLTPSTGPMKPLQPQHQHQQQHQQQHQRRQPLTSPALQNISPALRNLSPGLRHLSQSPRNISTNLKNISPNLKISPASKSSSPAAKSLPQTAAAALRNLSPALRIPPDIMATNQVVTMVKDAYDSDSQDVIFVDDSADDTRVDPPRLEADRIAGLNPAACSGKASKRPRSPLNGSLETVLPVENEASRKGTKRPRREPGGRKAKKRRNHTKSENRTVDHSLDPPAASSVGSPFLPISSASTSPALSAAGSLRNGIALKVSSPAPPVSAFAVDGRSRSPKPEPQKPRTSRKNGCKKPSNDSMMDDYSAFIKNKIPTSGKKVKTTKELLEEIQARKSGMPVAAEKEPKVPREDFLTAYDSKKLGKKDAQIVSAIIELNDSNSSSKTVDAPADNKEGIIKTETAVEESDEPVKFEPLEVILAKLPPVDRTAAFGTDDFAPVCTCSVIYNTPVAEDKLPAPPKKSIFEMDYDDVAKDSVVAADEDSNIVVPIVPTYEEKIDPYCKAAQAYHRRPSDVTDSQILVVHNSFVPGVNGTLNQKEPDANKWPPLACQTDEWGLRPYYDCSRDLFHSVVPKYRFLDYSLDGCLKNLARSNLDKYEPAEAAADSQSWFLDLEDARLKTDHYQTIADSPFSENLDRPGSSLSAMNVEINVSDIKDNNSQEANVVTISFDETANDAATNNNDPSFSKPGEEDEDCDNSIDDVVSRSSHDPFKTDILKDVEESRESLVDGDLYPMPELVESVAPKTFKRPRQFTYSDSVTLLPLSLAALNASVGYFDSEASDTNRGDLSCVFRTKDRTNRQSDSLSDNVNNSLTYQSISDATVTDLKDLSESSLDVLKRKRRDRLSFLAEHVDDDANCDSSDAGGVRAAVGGAFDASQDRKCLGGGCPRWISKSDAFREWQQPVVRTSYNGDPLTVLPYVVID